MSRALPLDPALAGSIVALLGPTNTGKTHATLQRMLSHGSGMIGLPLRLLAREVYDRLVAAKGAGQVALITGEEKRVPATARYFVCTTESMPVDRPVAFLAVDEVQLAGDRHRGHVFTDRILRARGVAETWFLGSDTVAPLLRELVPTVEIRQQPRLSQLRCAGHHKLHAVPPRSAIVAFSAERVLAIAERTRARFGGAAVVLGALSPRTRNAQVELFQSGDVAHLIATDAIGMGLNLDLHHVALASTSKFDGRERRELRPDELAQIAGRAGRYKRDGTFGTTDDAEPLSDELVEQIEGHRFAPLKRLYWRAAELDLSSLDALLTSLSARPPRRFLVGVQEADDAVALQRLAADPQIRSRAVGPDRVALLWEVCRVPDFGHVLPEHHASLLGQIFQRLVDRGELADGWLGPQLDRLDRVEGDIDALMGRVASLRVWTYIAHRAGWTAAGWADRAGVIEDKLSDALHQRLTARFVEHRAGVVTPAQAAREPGVGLAADGRVRLDGRVVGRVRGLGFEAEDGQVPSRPVAAAIARAVAPALRSRAAAIEAASDRAIGVDPAGGLRWDGERIGVLTPTNAGGLRVKLLRADGLEAPDRERVQRRLDRWLSAWLAGDAALTDALPASTPAGRAIVHAVASGPGAAAWADVRAAAQRLGAEERAALQGAGLRFGRRFIWLPRLLERIEGRAVRWTARTGHAVELPEDPRLPFRADWPTELGSTLGFIQRGGWWLRVDAVEALLDGEAAAAKFGIPAEVVRAVLG